MGDAPGGEATKAEIDALRWLIGRGHTESIDAVDLWPKYRDASDLRPHAMRCTAWKRTSARTMRRLKEKGLLAYHHSTFGSRHSRVAYNITEAGIEAAA